MTYNFVVLATPTNLYKYMWDDLEHMENVKVFWDRDEMLKLLPSFECNIAKAHIKICAERGVRLPGRKLWYRHASNKIKFNNNYPICFIWHYHFMEEVENGTLDYIKKKFPYSKHVYFITDAQAVNYDVVSFLKKKMDIVSVYDPSVAEKYGIKFFPNIYPYPDGAYTEEELDYDLCFVGGDKGREKVLREIAELCEKRSMRTAFYIGKTEEERVDGRIHFLKGKIPYKDVIEIVKRSRCLLELRVEPDCACTLRVQEAVIRNKKLLTNNKNVYRMPCCENSNGISFFETPDDIDWEFVKEEKRPDYHYNGEFSAKEWLRAIQENL